MNAYRERKKQTPNATFTLRSEHKEDLHYLTTEGRGKLFKAHIEIVVPNAPVDM